MDRESVSVTEADRDTVADLALYSVDPNYMDGVIVLETDGAQGHRLVSCTLPTVQ